MAKATPSHADAAREERSRPQPPDLESTTRLKKDARRKRRASRGALTPYLGIRSRNLELCSHLHTCTPRSLHLGLASLIVLAWLQQTCSLT